MSKLKKFAKLVAQVDILKEDYESGKLPERQYLPQINNLIFKIKKLRGKKALSMEMIRQDLRITL